MPTVPMPAPMSTCAPHASSPRSVRCFIRSSIRAAMATPSTFSSRLVLKGCIEVSKDVVHGKMMSGTYLDLQTGQLRRNEAS